MLKFFLYLSIIVSFSTLSNSQDRFERQVFVTLYYQKIADYIMDEFRPKCNDIKAVTSFNLKDYVKKDNIKTWTEEWYIKGCNSKDIYEVKVKQEKNKRLSYDIKRTQINIPINE